MYFNAEFPTQAIKDVIAGVRSGAYTAPETVDAALYAAGCLHAMRGPSVIGATHDDLTTCTLEDLAHKLEAAVAAEEAPADETVVAAAGSSFLWSVVLEIIRRLIEEQLSK